MTLEDLYSIILERKKTLPKGSYIASLFEGGINRIAQKVGEEAVEVVIASTKEGKERVISETADLLFHLLILLAAFNIKPEEIFDELEKRHKYYKSKKK